MSTEWTEGQHDAIFARGGSLLVSAAAGSGKTAVLVRRVIERITDAENPVDADRLLVVTFTKAAAAEMSARIEAQVSALLEADPYNVRLQRQQILLTRARICTIDSFCADLVRENFFRLGVSPDFRILEDSEITVLRAQAAEAALEEFYAEGNPEFLRFIDAFASGRDDAKIIETVERLYDFIRAHPFPKRWLSEKAALYHSAVPAGETAWGRAVWDYAEDALNFAVSTVQSALEEVRSDETMEAAYSEALRAGLEGLLELKSSVEQKNWDWTAALAADFAFPKFKVLRGYGDSPLKARVTALRDGAKDAVKELSVLFSGSEAECGEDIRRTAPLVDMLFRVTVRFSALLDEKKEARHAVDFSDLEHKALQLLVEDTGEGAVRTRAAEELSGRFEEIMVDEYQDTNEAQDLIFRSISRNGENLFFVGDVKQSIYRFRQAMPKLFLNLRESYPLYNRQSANVPACVVLDRNFRSRSGVTGTVNFVFRQLMSRQTGELDYTGREELVPAAVYPPSDDPEAALDIIDLSVGEGETDLIRAESRRIAERIYSMTDGSFSVTDHDHQRPAVYRDFCVLLRSANRFAHEYARELTALGIPAWADTVGGFFSAYEIGAAVSLLRVIDNPMQDIPLLSAMMSPIYGFTPDEISQIRTASRIGRLYPAVTAAAREGDAKASGFLRELEEFRTLAATMTADRLIRSVFRKTGLPELVQAMPNGELRLANLRLLLTYAGKYQASGYSGLSGFLRFIDRMQRSGADLSAASALSESANVVRIMSIHHSKGLEFPVCFVAGCSRAFHREISEVLLHPELGPGMKRRDPETGVRFSTLPRDAVALELERDGMSEELRVLYVAMTRARERLILVTSLKDPGKTAGALANRITEENRIPPYVVRGASSISDWLLLCALRHPAGKALRELAGAGDGIAVPAEEKWEIQIVRPPEHEEAAAITQQICGPDPKLMAKIREKLDFRYPYAELNGICAKVAASELAAEIFSACYEASSRPAFLSDTGLTPAERGTALHAYLQYADYAKAADDPDGELERLVKKGFLTSAEADAVELERMRAFFRSPVFCRILASPHTEREFRFTVNLPAGRISPDLPDSVWEEPAVLQGAVDCVFEEHGGLVIVDYKTDREKDPGALWERYREQLSLYRYALERCTGKKVIQRLLYSFYLDREISGD